MGSHHRCGSQHKVHGQTWHPKRVLDLNAPGPSHLALCEDEEIDAAHPYATLSHCWGKCRTIRLLAENRAHLKREIVLDEFPLTFQDAVRIARSLGARYLWIDSLCINQDSEDDWLEQAPLMGMIYEHALFGVAAAFAESDDGGCFAETTSELFEPKSMKFLSRSNKPMDIEGSVVEGVPVTLRGPVERDEPKGCELIEWPFAQSQVVLIITHAPRLQWPSTPHLHTRAWTVQERLLSPRILRFGSEMLSWECTEMRATEVDPLPSFEAGPFRSLAPRVLSETQDQSQRKRGPDSLFKAWYDIVEEYSNGTLTQGGDRLIAISSVAQRMQGLMKCRYCAGIWEKRIEEQLLWTVWSGSPGAKPPRALRPNKWRAPSWSWASVMGKVLLREDPTAPKWLVQVVDYDLDLLDSRNEYGPVTKGRLHVRGRLFVAGQSASVCGRETDEWESKRDLSLYIKFDADATADAQGLYFLPIKGRKDPTIGCVYLTGLALTRAGTGTVFKRMGVFDYTLLRNESHEHFKMYYDDEAPQSRSVIQFSRQLIKQLRPPDPPRLRPAQEGWGSDEQIVLI